MKRLKLSDEASEVAAVTVVVVVFFALLLVASFFLTTYIAMVAGGAIGHSLHKELLMKLGYWQYSPVWLLLILARGVFGGRS